MNKIKINPPIFTEKDYIKNFSEILSNAINVCIESVIKKTLEDANYKNSIIKNIKK